MLIEIESCAECSHHTISPTRTEDSFEYAEDWYCKLAKKEIASWVCWTEPKPKVPDWCPLRVSKSVKRRVDIQTGYRDEGK